MLASRLPYVVAIVDGLGQRAGFVNTVWWYNILAPAQKFALGCHLAVET